MAEEVLDGEIVAGAGTDPDAEATDPRPLPDRARSSELDLWRGEGRTVAIAAAGGLVAGAATVAVVNLARSRAARRAGRGLLRRGRRDREGIVASRSFLIDVHVLGR
jgi:hypothetical protein